MFQGHYIPPLYKMLTRHFTGDPGLHQISEESQVILATCNALIFAPGRECI